MLEQSMDPNIFPEVQGTAQYDLLHEANDYFVKNAIRPFSHGCNHIALTAAVLNNFLYSTVVLISS